MPNDIGYSRLFKLFKNQLYLSLREDNRALILDLINDWSSKHRPDIIHFVPYTWRFVVTLKHCEILTLTNQYNWVDTSGAGQKLENTQIALCAHFMHLSFDLPFDEFLPEVVKLNFVIQVK